MISSLVKVLIGVSSILISLPALAAVSADEAAKLSKDLTPLGAEKAGNADGSIPAWTGGITQPPAGYVGAGQHHIDPFPEDKPLFTITAQNMSQHAEKLSDGQKKLFETYPDTFQMPIYQTRRTHSLPSWIYDNTRKNATTAKLAEGGNGIINAYGGIPFPIPNDALEVIWNHITRYRGPALVRKAGDISVQRNGSYSLQLIRQEADFLYYRKDGSYETLDNVLFYYIGVSLSPPRLAGRVLLVHEHLDQLKDPRAAWVYNAGQRRVRRAPNIAYDNPIDGADGLRVADETDMYNGAPNRYDWKLIGKKEIYIPYNNYLLSSDKLKYDDIIQPGHLNPKYTRYELHRVWVVEATLKPDQRHIYKRRVLYLDEDSWSVAVADHYDARGDLWRVNMAYLKNFYDLPATWTSRDVFHDLQARRYHAQGFDNEESITVDFTQPSPPASYFKPAQLRRIGHR